MTDKPSLAIRNKLYDELHQHILCVMPVELNKNNPSKSKEFPGVAGSGVAIRISSKYFITTAGHIISEFDYETIFPAFITSKIDNLVQPTIGRGRHKNFDIGYLEISSKVAGTLKLKFLDISRFCSYNSTDVFIFGAPKARTKLLTLKNPPSIIFNADMYFVKELESDIMSHDDKIYLEWQNNYPHPMGLSGAPIFAPNLERHSDNWRAEYSQLIGIQYGTGKRMGHEYVAGTKINILLELLLNDYPSLKSEIEPYLLCENLNNK